MYNRRGPSLFSLIYLGVGVFVAADHKYFKNVDDVEAVLSAILAIILWPLLLFDVSLRIK